MRKRTKIAMVWRLLVEEEEGEAIMTRVVLKDLGIKVEVYVEPGGS